MGYSRSRCVLVIVYLVNLKFKDRFSINASADIHIAIHIAIHRYVYQLMGVFCDRLKLCSTAAPDCQTGQNKGRYRKQELSFLLILFADCKTYMQWVIVASIRSFHNSLTKAMMMLTIFLWLELRFLVGFSIFFVHYTAWNNIQTYLICFPIQYFNVIYFRNVHVVPPGGRKLELKSHLKVEFGTEIWS